MGLQKVLVGLVVTVGMVGDAEAKRPKAEAPAAAPEKPAEKPPVPRFEKQAIGACGCAVYAPPGLVVEAPTKSQDGADVWTAVAHHGGYEFGVVAVKFAEPFAEADPLEDLLVSYMDFLKSQLGITGAAGVGRGHTLESNPAAKGVIDYWTDAEGDSWAVKGWVDPKRLAVLYIAGKGEYPYFTAQQLYLDGFRFE